MTGVVAIIGAGQIGFAAAQAFVRSGSQVKVYSRSPPAWRVSGASHVAYQKDLPAPEADVVFDTIAFDAEDAARYDPAAVGRLIVVSSASVYCDRLGRTLDEAAANGFPDFPDPLTETQTTVAASTATYSTRKIGMEKTAIRRFGDGATILRPCAVHGPWSRHPREWWFVKRLLDGRRRIPLAHRGTSRFQTTSTQVIANFARHAGHTGLGGIFNVADADSPSVREIGEAIAQRLGVAVDWVPVPHADDAAGRTPWSVPAPMILSANKARATGFLHAEPYARSSVDAIDWLDDHAPPDWRHAFPQLASYPWNLFDYGAEDRFLNAL